MATNDFGAEQAENYERKLPCALVMDTSGSMSGSPITLANQGMKILEEDVLADSVAKQRLDLTIVTFDSDVKVVREFGLLGDEPMPTLSTTGTTKLVDGVRKAISLLEQRIDWYFSTGQDCYRPYLLIVTDGDPDGDQNISALKSELQALVDVGYDSKHEPGHPRKFQVMTFGVDGVPPEKLAQFSPTAPLSIKSANFKEFFKYIATVTKLVTKSRPDEKLNIAPDAVGAKSPFEAMS